MEQAHDFLFIAYLLRRTGRELDVLYHGCRTIITPAHKTPTYIRGVIEFEGDMIPVIDPEIFFYGKPTMVTSAGCILILEHIHKCRNRRTGIIIEDFEEIMNLAAGSYVGKTPTPPTFNMRVVLEISRGTATSELLSDTHTAFDLRERQKQQDEDFAAFRRIASGPAGGGASKSSRLSRGSYKLQVITRRSFARLSRTHTVQKNSILMDS